MFQEVLTRANIRVRTLFEQYQKIVDDNTACLMACVDGGQPELAEPILELRKQDQAILMEETFKHLVPREELYPLGGCPDGTYPVQSFALDDFQDDEIEFLTDPEDDVIKNNDDE